MAAMRGCSERHLVEGRNARQDSVAWGAAMTHDIDEARDWRGNDIDCRACAHRDLRAQGRCALKRACVEDRYARRIDRFFDQNPSLADSYLRHPHFETRAIAAKTPACFCCRRC